jgi:hypothetical protein
MAGKTFLALAAPPADPILPAADKSAEKYNW